MLRGIATFALAPILYCQGRYVRWRTPRLPEAVGPRHGTEGSGGGLRLLILGDSSAAGVGVDRQSEALSGRILSELSHEFRVNWHLLAKTGMTTRRMLALLRARSPGAFDVAVTALGVNDVTRRLPVSLWLDEQRQLWQLLRTQCEVSHIVVSGLPPVHLFPALPQPLRWFLGASATGFDRALENAVNEWRDCHFVSLRNIHETDSMARDGFHPGANAYADWGGRVARLITTVTQRSSTGKSRRPQLDDSITLTPRSP